MPSSHEDEEHMPPQANSSPTPPTSPDRETSAPAAAARRQRSHSLLERAVSNLGRVRSRTNSEREDTMMMDFDLDNERSRRSRDVSAEPTQAIQAGRAGSPPASLDPSASCLPDPAVASMARIDELIEEENMDLNTYGLSELRDGFFDGLFFKPSAVNHDAMRERARWALPLSFDKKNPLAPKHFFSNQWAEMARFASDVTSTRAGVRLAKAFIAYFAAYALCLVPTVRDSLGPYSYIMVVSTVINHPARAVGALLDGVVLTIIGTAAGLGWGAFGLWLSHSTLKARIGYGGILALFVCLYTAVMAWLRSSYVRFYQLTLCAGMAVAYTCLAEVRGEMVNWHKLIDYFLPWALGQAISLATCVLISPDAGARPLAVALHNAFGYMLAGLDIPRLPDFHDVRLRRRLAITFVNLSQVYRDLAIDISFTRFDPRDVAELRFKLQAVIRAILSLRTQTLLFDGHGDDSQLSPDPAQSPQPENPDAGYGEGAPLRRRKTVQAEGRAVRMICRQMAKPTRGLISAMKDTLQTCDAVLMDMSGYRKYLGPPVTTSTDLATSVAKLREAMKQFDAVENGLFANKELPPVYSSYTEVVKLFVFCRPIRQAANPVEAAAAKVGDMDRRKLSFPRLYWPSYPFPKLLNRTNAQTRHDRGGVTAGSYYKSFAEISLLIKKIKSREHDPLQQNCDARRGPPDAGDSYTMEADLDDKIPNQRHKLRYRIWKVIKHMQGFETRYALKVTLVTTLLSVPAWLPQSNYWWNRFEGWWAVVMAWLMIHPRVGGNLQDLVTRALTAVLGAVWSGAGWAAGQGNPYVMGVFATVFMIPMLYRYALSSHPRSGLVGCLSFTVISLGLIAEEDGGESKTLIATTRGIAFVAGVVAAVLINWVLWPFVARHELRKAMSTMIFFMSIIYRNVVAKYVYYQDGQDPTPDDIRHSEMLEARLREGFIRARQLLALTRHEIRLRGPFDPLPYSALIDACERLFEYLVAVRQASQSFLPNFIRDNGEAAEVLLRYRRDAVASVLSNLYILAGALRSNTRVPRYLPSAAAARKRLLDKMTELEEQYEEQDNTTGEQPNRWEQIYRYSFNESLTGCVAQVEELEKYTKEVVGEYGFYDEFDDEEMEQKEAAEAKQVAKYRHP